MSGVTTNAISYIPRDGIEARGNAVHETIDIVTRKMTRCVDSSYGMMVSSDASG